MSYTILTPATAEPVTLAECKLALRIEDSASDSDLLMLIKSARELAEQETSSFLAQQEVRLSLTSWPSATEAIAVKGPVSAAAVSYWSGSSWSPVDTSQFVTYLDGTRWYVAPLYSWPTLADRPGPRARIDLTVGYSPAFVPACAKRFIVAHVASWFANVEAAGKRLEINPLLAGLLDPLRTYA